MVDITNRQIIGDGATWMCSTQFGAPQMDGNANSNGQLLQVLDAVLINGFNPQIASAAELMPDGYVKIKFGVSTGFKKRQKILISGANDANLNGEHIITQIIGNDAVIKSPNVTVLTGTITAKVAPLGWESVFGSANPLKRAYRSKNPSSTQTVLYLDMALPSGHGYNSTKPYHRAMVSLCEDMVDIEVPLNSYADLINDKVNNVNGSLFWKQKASGNKDAALQSTGASPWTIIGNGDYFYLMIDWSSEPSLIDKGLKDFYCFGDVPSYAGSTDRWSCVWTGAYSPNDTIQTYSAITGASVGYSNSRFYIADTTGALNMRPFALTTGGGAFLSGRVNLFSYPNPSTNSLITSGLHSVSDGGLRSLMPRMMAVQHNLSTFSSNFREFDNNLVDDVLLVSVSASIGTSTSTDFGVFAFDMGD